MTAEGFLVLAGMILEATASADCRVNTRTLYKERKACGTQILYLRSFSGCRTLFPEGCGFRVNSDSQPRTGFMRQVYGLALLSAGFSPLAGAGG